MPMNMVDYVILFEYHTLAYGAHSQENASVRGRVCGQDHYIGHHYF